MGERKKVKLLNEDEIEKILGSPFEWPIEQQKNDWGLLEHYGEKIKPKFRELHIEEIGTVTINPNHPTNKVIYFLIKKYGLTKGGIIFLLMQHLIGGMSRKEVRDTAKWIMTEQEGDL